MFTHHKVLLKSHFTWMSRGPRPAPASLTLLTTPLLVGLVDNPVRYGDYRPFNVVIIVLKDRCPARNEGHKCLAFMDFGSFDHWHKQILHLSELL